MSLLLLLITGQKDIVKDFFSFVPFLLVEEVCFFIFYFIFLIKEEVCFKMSKNNKIRRAFESTIEYRYHQTCIDWIDGFAFEFDGIDDTCVACTSLLLASLFSSTTSFIYVLFYNYIHIMFGVKNKLVIIHIKYIFIWTKLMLF